MPLRFRSALALRFASLAAFFPLVLAGCGGGDPGPATWVGTVQGSDAVVALVEEDGAMRAYVCGGGTTYATHSRWFAAETDDSGGFTAGQDGWSITGGLGAELASGTLAAPDGAVLSFDARPIESAPEAIEGLYAVETPGCRTGAIVQHDAAGEILFQGAWCDDENHFEQVTPVLPIERTELGIRILVDLTKLGKNKLDLYAKPVQAH